MNTQQEIMQAFRDYEVWDRLPPPSTLTNFCCSSLPTAGPTRSVCAPACRYGVSCRRVAWARLRARRSATPPPGRPCRHRSRAAAGTRTKRTCDEDKHSTRRQLSAQSRQAGQHGGRRCTTCWGGGRGMAITAVKQREAASDERAHLKQRDRSRERERGTTDPTNGQT